jgi:hypothetical protein
MVPSVPGRQCRLHWAAAAALRSLSEAWCASGPGRGVLLVASGWRQHRWASREVYLDELARRYRHRTDLPCRAQGGPCPCMPGARRACLYLAYDSPHETGLALDLGSGGLEPVSATLARQRRTALHAWLEAHAAEHGFVRLASEPWHLEYGGLSREAWLQAGPEAG